MWTNSSLVDENDARWYIVENFWNNTIEWPYQEQKERVPFPL